MFGTSTGPLLVKTPVTTSLSFQVPTWYATPAMLSPGTPVNETPSHWEIPPTVAPGARKVVTILSFQSVSRSWVPDGPVGPPSEFHALPFQRSSTTADDPPGKGARPTA